MNQPDTSASDAYSFVNRYAPVTYRIGYLRADVRDVATAATQSFASSAVRIRDFDGGLRRNVARLEPLTLAIRPRMLFVQAQGGWVASFDCSARGSDQEARIGSLASKLDTTGVAIAAIPPSSPVGSGRTPYGALILQLFNGA